ncbi:branched-chain amino acid transporter [Candidatus Dependentiae bacterium]|nr:branched-chain amino acid transporter [Candidatus Dependentiae bacterium]
MHKHYKIILSTGLAMFSMFFGAGNVVFPLDLGRVAGSLNLYAILGLLLTAVLVPFTGLLTMFLFAGDYEKFFQRIGKIPGFFIIAFLMALIGPFMAMPRCITLSFSTMQMYFPGMSLFYFSLGAVAFIYFLTVNRKRILDLLGYILSPLLLTSLTFLIIKGLLFHPKPKVTDFSRIDIFLHGLREGYYTMDLLGAFFFSVVILLGLQRALGKDFKKEDVKSRKSFFKITLISSGIGAFLLGIVYTGFSYVSSFYSSSLNIAQKDTVLSVLASTILGPIGGVIANLAVTLACLTTAMTLAAVFSEFIQNELFKNKLNYRSCLLVTLILTFAMSNLGFMGIIKMSEPILLIGYPVLIVLTFLNLAKKLFGFKPVKVPVLITLILSAIFYFMK